MRAIGSQGVNPIGLVISATKDACNFQDGLDRISTPAFVYDEGIINRLLDHTDSLRKNDQCQVLFSIKSFSFADALKIMAPRLDGFAVSSLFEARLARSVVGQDGSIHITSPGIKCQDVDAIGALCDFVAFNSLNQWDMYQDRLYPQSSCGIRVNPQISFLDDERYDPCRPDSKLGVPLDELVSTYNKDPGRLAGLDGILFHSNCDSPDFDELLTTVKHLYSAAADILPGLNWINLGGGYLFDDGQNLEALDAAVELLKSRFDLQVFFEPGSALIRSAGYLVSTVIDVFPSGGSKVVVLDTSVNHMPEVFEYDFEPDVMGHEDDAPNEFILAGSTCLAGDVFGTYRFPRDLHVGDKVVFNNAGAYTLTKANTFNGFPLPSVYAATPEGELIEKSHFTYNQYAARWGIGPDVLV